MKLTFVLVISVLAHLVVLVPPALASECSDTAGIAWVSGKGGMRDAWHIHGFVSIGSDRVDARGVSMLSGSGNVFIAEGATVSCADVDGNGVAGVVSIDMQFRSVRSGRVLIAAIVPDAGEMDEGGLYGVTFRVDDMTLAGEVLLVPAAGARAQYITSGDRSESSDHRHSPQRRGTFCAAALRSPLIERHPAGPISPLDASRLA